MTITNDTQ